MKKKLKLQIPTVWIWIVSTLYSSLYISFLWIDYFNQTSIHESRFLFYLFIVIGIVSLLLSYPTISMVKKEDFVLGNGGDKITLWRKLRILSRINLSLVIINIISFTSWVTFIAGPGV